MFNIYYIIYHENPILKPHILNMQQQQKILNRPRLLYTRTESSRTHAALRRSQGSSAVAVDIKESTDGASFIWGTITAWRSGEPFSRAAAVVIVVIVVASLVCSDEWSNADWN